MVFVVVVIRVGTGIIIFGKKRGAIGNRRKLNFCPMKTNLLTNIAKVLPVVKIDIKIMLVNLRLSTNSDLYPCLLTPFLYFNIIQQKTENKKFIPFI